MSSEFISGSVCFLLIYYYKKYISLILVNPFPLMIYIIPHPLSLSPLKEEREEIFREAKPPLLFTLPPSPH
jgi:hypothetical protein